MKSVFFVCDICNKTVKKSYLIEFKIKSQIIMNGEGKVTEGPEHSRSVEVCDSDCALGAFSQSYKSFLETEKKDRKEVTE